LAAAGQGFVTFHRSGLAYRWFVEIFALEMKELLSLCAIGGALFWGYSESEHSKQLQAELDQTKAALVDAQQRLVVYQQQPKKATNTWMWSANSMLNAPVKRQ